ncbi:MAG TPA: FAD-dependent oxidoreductase, partial [Pararhizobium sp.]|nr:FAD-dependent oxidoreductase [Pararhizobium sp.]
TGVEQADEGVRVACERDGSHFSVTGSTLLVATGRLPNIGDLGLGKAGIVHDAQGIQLRRNLKTTNRRVYAIGDVAGGMQSTRVAACQAALVVRQILFRLPARENCAILPRAIYTDPELAHVGLSEDEARRRHRRIRVLRWPLSANDRAQIERQTDGLIKIVTTARGRILGASIAGLHAGEMISLWSLAVSKGLTVADIRAYVPPYPTLAEIGKRAALSYYHPVPRKMSVRRIVRLLSRLG